MGGFLAVGAIGAFVLGLVAYFFNLPTLSLVVSGLFLLVSGGLMLYQTSEIIRGGETNYIQRDGDAVRQHLQHVPQPAAPAGFRFERRLTADIERK